MKKFFIILCVITIWAVGGFSFLVFLVSTPFLNKYAEDVRSGKIDVSSESSRKIDRWAGLYRIEYTILLPDKTVRLQNGLPWLSSYALDFASFCAYGIANTPTDAQPVPVDGFGEAEYEKIYGHWWNSTVCAM